jgi:hypothetical protein
MADRGRNSADEEHSKCGLAALHAFEEFCHRCPMLENSAIKGGDCTKDVHCFKRLNLRPMSVFKTAFSKYNSSF